MGAPKIKVPKPSSAEQQLQQQQAAMLQEQTDILREQRAMQDALLPVLAQQYGFSISYDDQGNPIFTESDPESRARREEILRLEEEQSLKALRGELDVDPNLERSIEQQEQTLRERLQAQFGPGYETSTPGIQTLDQFFQSSEGLRYGARTGQLTLAEQLALARTGSNLASGSGSAAGLTGATLGNQLGLAGAYGQSAGGYGNAASAYFNNRSLVTNARAQEASLMQKYLGGIGELVGTAMFSPLSGTGAGALATMFSDRSLKENIRKVADTLHGIGIYIYNIKGDDILRLGLMADEVEEIYPDAVTVHNGLKMVDYGVL